MITTVTARDAALPVSLLEAKEHLRVIDDALDEAVSAIVGAATEYCESASSRSLRKSTTLAQKYRNWPCNPVRFDRNPVLENQPGSDPVTPATVVQYRDTDGVLQTVSASNYRVHISSEAASYLEFDDGFSRPSLDSRDDAVVITYMAGYGTPNAVPLRAKQAILLLTGHWFEHGEAVDIGSSATAVPMGVYALLGSLDAGVYR